MDEKLLLLINRQWISPVLDRVMALLSSFPAWVPLLLILVALLLWRGGFHARALVLCAAMIVGVNDGVISRTLKQLVGRPRPYESLDGVRQVDLGKATDFGKATPRLLALGKPLKIKLSEAPLDRSQIHGHSFPSSHTINTISVALLVACFYRRFGWLAFLPALGVAYSRIYTGAHWPTDVCASIFLGLGATLLLLATFEWLWTNAGGRWWPRFHERHPSLIPS